MSVRASVVLCSLLSAAALAGERAAITYKAPPASEDDRPLITEIVIGPQGSDYALKVEFNREPWGDTCKTRCALATIFVDTDSDKASGLKLRDPKAAETGADMAITVQGLREYREGSARSMLKVKVKQYAEDNTAVEDGETLLEMDQVHDDERVLAQGTSVYVLIDANRGSMPVGKKMRIIYHPPDSKPLVGSAKGLTAAGASRIEIFKDGRLANPVKKKKPVY